MEYVAFKALVNQGGAPYSPIQALSRAEQWLYAYIDGRQDEKN